MTAYNLVSFAGIFVLAGVAWLFSIGGTGALVPTRVRDLSRIGFRALLAATLACLMTGAVAGTFCTGSSVLFGR